MKSSKAKFLFVVRMLAAFGSLAVFLACNSDGPSETAANQEAGVPASTGGTNASGTGGGGATGVAEAGIGTGGAPIGGDAAPVGTGGSNAGGSGAIETGGTTLVDAGEAGTGGATRIDAGEMPALDGSRDGSSCNYPKCLFDLLSLCSMTIDPVPSCIIQDTTTSTKHQTNACYGDGTSASSTTDLTTNVTTMVFKKGGSVCYTMDSVVTLAGVGTPSSVQTTYKDGSGNAIAMSNWDVATKATTVTCTGAQPVVLNAACDESSSGNLNCQPGVCNP